MLSKEKQASRAITLPFSHALKLNTNNVRRLFSIWEYFSTWGGGRLFVLRVMVLSFSIHKSAI